MTYEEKEDSREVILVGYYNVLFYLIFRVGLDEYKKDILIERIRSGERMVMKDIYRWCEGHPKKCCLMGKRRMSEQK